MSSTLAVALLIVVWIFVLAPIVVRNQKPIRKTTDALEKTRVVVSGGEIPAGPRRPRLLPTDVHVSREELAGAEDVDDADIIIEDSPRAEAPAPTLVPVDGFVEEDEADEEERAVVEDVPLAEDAYDIDDAYMGPADLLHPEAEYVATDVEELAENRDEAQPSLRDAFTADDLELSDEDRAFAESRLSATAYNPQREAEKWARITARRRRALAGFGIACVLSLLVALAVGSFAWALPVLAIGFSVAYLVALRNQVVLEKNLRAQRIARLRRQRLGVRTSEDPSVRRSAPGTVAVMVDDESPDFVELEVAEFVSWEEPAPDREVS
ncbi:hypothetical protein C1Y63_01410 [Corynebacterium sp. 13CS0277]|uniref:divisome protein SepX/GlpR n=1 Tax=Corynebacterium sp. 13CS0277 TaxID=2071994 RepID=UPI000D039553|nr:gephyrin-like molybdotransferase receptor GlpR [Corynebacterium sp. 13CS0277]PRQ12477.1 hypothetical protein C1Y63_01410 [Corynebacterium sp. 13CS0277]